ncbi:lanthionine synthetase [Planotetraspora silvatica]|uniref:Lanthionine synthetase n=1 Tax=Planotetraspora silvatica TaxID=234614 RepID=A0A8J3UHR3_9ACTN|nr:type 2 lanthipeptide synthetase LanM family protein [Planotetraspora silvatica]GII43947.1 lanthionine synthetase [Planotetraspora silvatica]
MPPAGSVDAQSPASAAPTLGTTAGLPPHWWAAGLSLAERLRLPGYPVQPAGEERLARAQRRLERWRDSHGLGKDGHFARLLAERDLDTDRLLALLAEDPEDLATRAAAATGRPAWAGIVEAVLEAMPAEPDGHRHHHAPQPEGWEGLAGFVMIISPFVRFAVKRFDSAVREDALDHLGDVAGLGHQMAEVLAERLATLASRTLVLELNVHRVTGRLHGDTPEERFWSFVQHFSSRDALAELMSEYVVLARLLAQACDQAIETHHELLARLAGDRDEIMASIFHGEDPGALVEIQMGGGVGDAHQGGRSVALLRFAGGARLVYKPRPLSVHRHVNDAIGWLDERLPGYDLRSLNVLDRRRYGWVEFVDYASCADDDETRWFYRRQGALLALLYALDGADFHYENLIAAGDQPVLVDLEAVFHPEVRRPSRLGWMNDDPAAFVLGKSVSRIGLLPAIVWNEDGDVLDMGGIGGDAGQTMPFKVPGWSGSGTDEMRLTRENAAFPGSRNRPSVGGQVADPTHFIDDLMTGFRAGYQAIAAHRDDLLEHGGLLGRFADDEIRVVMRATRLYGSVLMESTHPDVLRDALDRDRIFDFLWALAALDPVRRSLVPMELEELWAGDIPLFTTRPASRDLWSGRGTRARDLLDRDSLSRSTGKIRGMGPQDLTQQEWIIQASMATRPDRAAIIGAPSSARHSTPPSPRLDPERVVAAVRRIADQLAEQALGDGERVSWLGVDQAQASQSRWEVNPLGTDLYNGIPGVAVFLVQAAAVTGDDRYADLARRAMTPLPQIVDSLVDPAPGSLTPTCGAFFGHSGLAYSLTHLSGALGDPALRDMIEPLVNALAASIPADETLDVVGGAAGALAALLAVHESTGLPVALRLAGACGDRLVETAGPQEQGVAWPGTARGGPPLSGFSHGTAGIGWALARLAAVAGDSAAQARYAATAHAAFAYERGQYDSRIGNWPDHRSLPGRPTRDDGLPDHMQAWCHGAPGIGLARADVLRRGAAGAEALNGDLDLALASFLAGPVADNGHSLCHGELGNLELLTTAIDAGRTHLTEARDRRLGVVLDQLDAGPRCGTPGGVPTPSLMCGLAGIGHGLLRHTFPDRVPSLLLLQPPID